MKSTYNKASQSDLHTLSSFLQKTQKSSQHAPAVAGGVMDKMP